MNITLSVDEKIVAKVRARLRSVGKSLNQEIRDHLQQIAGEDDVEREIEFFVKTSGQGKPAANWKWNRDEVYEDRIEWPRK